MKKVMIIATMLLGGFVAQAATVSWTLNNIQASPTTAAEAGWLIQLYDASTVFSFADAKAGSITALDSAASVASGTIFKASGTFGNYSPNDTVSAYAVLFDAATVSDATNYIISDTMTKTIAASGANQSMAFGNMASTATSNMFRNSSWTATGSGPEPVPEPTSGLLFLLGMAGLALKRKLA